VYVDGCTIVKREEVSVASVRERGYERNRPQERRAVEIEKDEEQMRYA